MSFELFIRDNKEVVGVNVSTPTDANALAEFIENNKIDTIVISAEFGFRDASNIDFISNIKEKQRIKEIHIFLEHVDYSVIYNFNNLEQLTLCNNKKNNENLDLTLLPSLKLLSLNGNFEIKGLETSQLRELMIYNLNHFKFFSKCDSLEKLKVICSKKFDLEQLMFFPNLKYFTLTQSKLTSLNGIEQLKNIENIAINYCSKLIDISKISECSNIRKLEFHNCKKVVNFNSLSSLKKLQGLILGDCGSIPSLSFIKDMNSLKFLSFVNTNILDGDLTECLKLESVGTMNKKHYNIKAKDLPDNDDYAFWKL